MVYNTYMTSQKWRRILVVILFLIALGFLLWGYFPMEHITETLPLPPGNLRVPTPTPSGFIPGILALF